MMYKKGSKKILFKDHGVKFVVTVDFMSCEVFGGGNLSRSL